MSSQPGVYALVDPRDRRIRYVGRSGNPDRRFRVHVTRPQSPRMREWIEELRRLGLSPELRRLDGATEREWIIRLTPDINERGGTVTPVLPGKEMHFTVWVTPEQEDMITRAALADDEARPSVWIRKVVLRAALEVLAARCPAGLVDSDPVDRKKGERR